MKHIETCPCGIAKVDCDYHRPEEKQPDLAETFRKCLEAAYEYCGLVKIKECDYLFRDGDVGGVWPLPAWDTGEGPEVEEDEEPEVDEYEDENPGT